MADEAEPPGATEGDNKMPKAAYVILAHKTIFDIGYFSVSALYMFFLRNKLNFTNDETTSIRHTVASVGLALTLVGGILADSVSNKFVLLTIGRVLMVLMQTALTLASLPMLRHMGRELLYVKLCLEVFHLMCERGVVDAFSGNQFKLPQQQRLYTKFYEYYYICHNVGVLVGYYIAPTFKTEIACMGEQDCYALGFGLSLIFAVMSIIIFIGGYSAYLITKPERNMAFDIFRCLGYGFIHWKRERKTNPQLHWLDHAEPAYGAQLVEDLKRFSRLLVIFLTVPIYFAVYYQLESKWIFQAARLDGRVGSYTIIPEHFQLLNPILAIILGPICIHLLDPLLEKCYFDRLFRRILFGGCMLALSFVAAGILELQIKKTNPTLPLDREGQLRIFNGLDCPCLVQETKYLEQTFEISENGVYTNKHVPAQRSQGLPIKVTGSCFESFDDEIFVEEGQAISVHLVNIDGKPNVITRYEFIAKTEKGLPIITVVGAKPADAVQIIDSKGVKLNMVPIPTHVAGYDIIKYTDRVLEVAPETYEFNWNGKKAKNKFKLDLGGQYVMMLSGEKTTLITVTEPNSVHMAWIIPQSVLLVFGEIYYGIVLKQFFYREAPNSMKSLVSALNTFGSSLGQTMIVLITNVGGMQQYIEFFFYSMILFANMGLLFFIALKFKSIHDEKLI